MTNGFAKTDPGVLREEVLTKLKSFVQRIHEENLASGRIGVPRAFNISSEGDVVGEVEAQVETQPGHYNGVSELGNRAAGHAVNPLGETPEGDILSPTAGPAANRMTGYQLGSTQVVELVGSDGHPLEFSFTIGSGTHGWHFNDLVERTGADASNGPEVSYATNYNNQKHVAYIASDSSLRELNYDTSWHLAPDPLLAGAQTTGKALSGFQTTYNNQEHIEYVDASKHVIELWHDSAWHKADLSSLAANQGVNILALNTYLAGYQTTSTPQPHVIFVDTTNRVNELYNNGAWHPRDLLAVAVPTPANLPAVTALPSTRLAAYETTFSNQQHIDFLDSAGHITELWYDGTWHRRDLMTTVSAVDSQLPDPASPLAGYQTTFDNHHHVVYISKSNHVMELLFDTAWHLNDLSVASGINPVLHVETFAITGYQTTGPNQQHIDFVTSGSDTTADHVHELWFDTAWHDNDLSAYALNLRYTQATGTWRVPAVRKPTQPPGTLGTWESSSWVGLNGEGGLRNNILQTGVRQSVSAGGTASYVGWYEWFRADPMVPPDPQYIFETRIMNFTPRAGDTMFGQVTLAGGTGTAFLWDRSLPPANTATSANSFVTTQLAPPAGAETIGQSAEWFMEAPDGAEPNGSLPAFDPVIFSQTSVTDTQGAVFGATDLPGYDREIERPDYPMVGLPMGLTKSSATNNQVEVDFVDTYAYDISFHLTSTLSNNALAGFALNSVNQEHVVYITSDFDIKDSYFDGLTVWNQDNDLTLGATNGPAPAAAATSKIDAYVSTSNNQAHVDYVAANNHVIEFVYDGTWHWTDLSMATGLGVLPRAQSRLPGYETTWNGQQHVHYVGTDNHVYELYFDTAWHKRDVTTQPLVGGTPLVAASSVIGGYATTFNNQGHVNFVDATSNHIYELYFDTAWHKRDLTSTAGATAPAAGSALDGFQSTWNNQQHIEFVCSNSHVCELWFDTSWHFTDLTTTTGTTGFLASAPQVTGYPTTPSNQLHVDFIANDQHIHEFWYDTAWHHRDLTVVPVVPNSNPAVLGSPIDGFVTTQRNQQHVLFIDGSGQIEELQH